MRISITPDRSYVIRIYQPRAEIIADSRTFPEIESVSRATRSKS